MTTLMVALLSLTLTRLTGRLDRKFGREQPTRQLMGTLVGISDAVSETVIFVGTEEFIIVGFYVLKGMVL